MTVDETIYHKVDVNYIPIEAGNNVSIGSSTNSLVISATDTTYTAGTGIDITNNVISNTVDNKTIIENTSGELETVVGGWKEPSEFEYSIVECTFNAVTNPTMNTNIPFTDSTWGDSEQVISFRTTEKSSVPGKCIFTINDQEVELEGIIDCNDGNPGLHGWVDFTMPNDSTEWAKIPNYTVGNTNIFRFFPPESNRERGFIYLTGTWAADTSTVFTGAKLYLLETDPTQPIYHPIDVNYVPIDNDTLVIDNGVIKAASSGSSYTFTNGLSESGGTVSWVYNDDVKEQVSTNEANGIIYSRYVNTNPNIIANIGIGTGIKIPRSYARGTIVAGNNAQCTNAGSGNMVSGSYAQL